MRAGAQENKGVKRRREEGHEGEEGEEEGKRLWKEGLSCRSCQARCMKRGEQQRKR